ncbi:MAG: hypothetical protein HY689_10770 [Chloroflexi bacterium]|nr:hypothetical protein [Chloroflexota bacterium]
MTGISHVLADGTGVTPAASAADPDRQGDPLALSRDRGDFPTARTRMLVTFPARGRSFEQSTTARRQRAGAPQNSTPGLGRKLCLAGLPAAHLSRAV